MYHYIEDKDYLKRMRSVCSGIVNQLVQRINNDDEMTVQAILIGSGAKNLETQNEKAPVDLDYNIWVKKSVNWDERFIKEYIRKQFNIILYSNGWSDCKDSKTVLTTEQRFFQTGNKTPFSIDLGIVCEEKGKWFRLKHKKTGNTYNDEYFWNEYPNSAGLTKKVNWIKNEKLWNEVRTAYLNKKNMYLSRQDKNHPSFKVYIEAVNEVYNRYCK